MTTQNQSTEEDLEEAFKEDVDFGLEMLHEEFRDRIARYIKKCGPSLTPDEIKDLYQDTMVEMVGQARSPDFNPERPLRLVQTIAKRRTFDRLRRKTSFDAILPHVAKDLGGSDLQLRWKYLDKMIQAEFKQALFEEIGKLPERQRIVATAFVDNYEDLRERDTYLPLAQAVAAITGEDENVVAVKSAWHEAKRKLVRGLTRRGFNFLEEN
jgi:DNA-directed RNA polymerase specialized sigma24 family protein